LEFLISDSKILFVSEDSTSLQAFIDQANKLILIAFDSLEGRVKIIDRLGVRFIEILSSNNKSFEEVHKKFMDKIYKNPFNINLEYTDVQTILVHKYGRFGVGPTKKEDDWIKINFQQPEKNIPDFGIALDIDSYGSNLRIGNQNDLKIAINSVIEMTITIEESILRALDVINE
jgi:hypothetical protein